MNNLNDLKNIIYEDIKKFATNTARYTAHMITEDLTEVTKTAIEIFYSNYDPESRNPITYYRNWNFKESFKKYYSNHNPVFTGGVELLMNELPDVYSGTNAGTDAVFWRVYSGYHGIASFQSAKGQTRTIVPIMRPAPIDMILDKRDEISKHIDRYIDKASSMALNDNYQLIH